MRTKSLPPPPPPVTERRLTIPVSLAVYDAFSRMAKAGKMPISRAMGEWLGDTVEAAEFMAAKMEEAKAAPRMVAMEMHSYALGLTDMTQELLGKLAKESKGGGSQPSAAAATAPVDRPPRPVIRGGNLPKNAPKRGNP